MDNVSYNKAIVKSVLVASPKSCPEEIKSQGIVFEVWATMRDEMDQNKILTVAPFRENGGRCAIDCIANSGCT